MRAASVRTTDAGTRGRRGPLLVGVMVVCMLIGAFTVLLVKGDDDGTSTMDAAGADTRSSGWTRLPDPPLSPRVGASAAWTGQEIVVVGGWEFLCPPGADCAGPTEAPFTDGAAFDPSTETWRQIADAPAAFHGERAAVAAGSIFVLVECESGYTGIDGEPAEDRCPQSDQPGLLLEYDPSADTWAQLPGPPSDQQHAIEAVGDSIIAFASSEERGEQQEWRFDLTTATWTELPDDPLPLMYDRSIVSTDGGRSALLFGANAETGPSSEPSEEVNLAARLELDTMTWKGLPPSPSRGYRAWGVDDAVVLEPHFGGSGGLFEPASSTWSALTSAEPASFDSNQVAGTLGQHDAVYVEASGWVFDAEQDRWIEIEPVDDRGLFPQSSVTAVGRDLFISGGDIWASSGGELLGDAWMWVAPRETVGTPATIDDADVDVGTSSSSRSHR